MTDKRKYIIISLISVCILGAKAQAADFQSFDLDEALRSHPVYQNYDPKLHCFKETPSEVFTAPELQKRISVIQAQIKDLNKKKSESVDLDMILAIDGQSDDWGSIQNFDQKLESLTTELNRLTKQLSNNCIPEGSEFSKSVQSIYSDIQKNIESEKTNDEAIVLNKLPNHLPFFLGFAPEPDLENRFTYEDALAAKDKDMLTAYIFRNRPAGYMLRSIEKPVLYRRCSNEK